MSGRLRLLPLAAAAAACLLVLKGVAVLRSLDQQPQAPPRVASAAPPETPRARPPQAPILDPDITGAVPAKKKEEEKPPEPAAPPPAPPAPPPGAITGSAERAILERLGERREEIEGRAREMDTREALLRAAEKKLDARVTDLKTLEEKLQTTQDGREQSQAQTMKNLIVMYETMKPKEAARVFDRLDLKVLVPVVQKMNPRKMAEILAAMTPEAAERLTIALATRAEQPVDAAAAPPANELPRLEAPPRAPAPAPQPR